WLNEPATWQRTDDVLTVSADAGTDFWRETGYGYVHDNGHVYGELIEGDLDLQVKVRATLVATYDQAGLILRVDDEVWLKTGLELFDGRPRLSTVLTLGKSSWMVTDLPEGTDELILRASRRGDAVEVRYIVGDGPAELAALAYLPPERPVLAGVMCAAPEGAGFRVTFHNLRLVNLEAPGEEEPLWSAGPAESQPAAWTAGTGTDWEQPEVSDDAATPRSAWPALTEPADEPVHASLWPDPEPVRDERSWSVPEPARNEPPWSIPEPASGPAAYETWASSEVVAEQEPTLEPAAEAATEEPGWDGDVSEATRDPETGRTSWFGGASPDEEGAGALVPGDWARDEAADAALPAITATGTDAPDGELPQVAAAHDDTVRDVELRDVELRDVGLRDVGLRDVGLRGEAHGPEAADDNAADGAATPAGDGLGEKAEREPDPAELTPWSAWEPISSDDSGAKALDAVSPRTAPWDPASPDTADTRPRDDYLAKDGYLAKAGSLDRDSADGGSEDADSARAGVAESLPLPPPPPAAWVAKDLTDRWPGPPLVSIPDETGADAVGPHDPVPAVSKRTKPKPAPVLDDPVDPADEWISLLTTDPADE
ncbi:MAG TPA: DUF1349 domain-containing protein, partial [Streptosporangiaceae bacterium]|nr:DUF1349 domain-containing protein [Streptosporangiaceae bacterium]